MTSERTSVKLSEVAKIVGGGTPSTTNANYWGGEIPWITPKDLSSHENIYISKGSRCITELGLKESSAKLVPKGTVLFTSRAPIGYIAIASQPVSTNQGFKSLVLNEGHDNRFFYYLLKYYTPLIEARATGSTFKEISGASLGDFEVEIPAWNIQKNIGDFLGAIDDRIALLRETNSTLEALAQTLFKSWFIDFDPVHKRQSGQPEGTDKITAALFPDSFEQSELGSIPSGWRAGEILDLGEVVCGKTPPTREQKYYGAEVPFITIPDMHNNLTVIATGKSLSFEGADTQKNKYLRPGSVCVSCIATPGLVSKVTVSSQTNQNINSVVPNEKWGDDFVLFVLRQIGNQVKSAGAGGSVFNTLSSTKFSQLKVLLPSVKIANLYNDSVSPMIEKITVNKRLIENLSNIRDAILPKLINGSIKIDTLDAAT